MQTRFPAGLIGVISLPVSLIALFVAALVAASSALAQQKESRNVLEEVIVTAGKREQSLLDIAGTVSVVSGDNFRKYAAFDLKQLGEQLGGVELGGLTLGDQNIIIRGTGNGRFSASFPARVAIYFDEAPVFSTVVFLPQYDLERFELLRGPQGSLYGRSATTGSLNILSKRPTMDQFEGYTQATASEYDGANLQFGYGGPLIQNKLAFRIAGSYDEADTQDIQAVERGHDPFQRTKSGRLSLLWQPTERLSITPSYQYTDYDSRFMSIATGAEGLAQFGISGVPLSVFDRIATEDGSGNIQRYEFATLRAKWELTDKLVLSSTTYYLEGGSNNFGGGDGTPFFNRIDIRDNDIREVSQEIQLSSSGNDFWDYILGAYYGNSKSDTLVGGPGITALAPGQVFVNATNLLDARINEQHTVFMQNTFNLTDKLSAIVGLRYSDQSVKAVLSGNINVYPGADIDPSNPFSIIDEGDPLSVIDLGQLTPAGFEAQNFYNVSESLRLLYEFTDNLNVYVAYDTGNRAGAANFVRGDAAEFLRDVIVADEETSQNIEIGLKLALGRVRYTFAAYHQSYKDFQLNPGTFNYIGNNNTIEETGQIIFNTGEAVSTGVDIEIAALIADNWSVDASITYVDATLEDATNVPCSEELGTLPNPAMPQPGDIYRCDFSGQRIGEAPNWSSVFGTEISFPWSSLGAELFINGRMKAVSFDVDPATGQRFSGYATVDLFTGLRSTAHSWAAQFWVKNLFDRQVITGQTSPTSTLNPILDINGVEALIGNRSVSVLHPRTVGLTASYNF